MTVENAREKTITDHLASYSPKKKKKPQEDITYTHTNYEATTFQIPSEYIHVEVLIDKYWPPRPDCP